MPNLEDVLVEHNKICTAPGAAICPRDGCSACEFSTDTCASGCPRCAQEKLLAWQRENCKLEPIKNTFHPIEMNRQLFQDQQAVNKILGVE
ncbi:hypothetical protein ASJ33_05495 [Dehalococcoides mccartyi]|nr:hypothetical protein ASJ33_05495 [Dehalococcoides mccartyi]